MSTNIDLDRVTSIVQNILDNFGMRLYDLQCNEVSHIIRVFIDRKEGGITVKDCKNVSPIISKALDEAEVVTYTYTLEVSSPGIDRHLKHPEHYQWAVGKLIELDVGSKKIKGYLRSTAQDGIVIATDQGENHIPYTSIVKAKVAEELEYGKRR